MNCKSIALFITCAAMTACTGGGESVAGIDARGGDTRVGVVSQGSISGFGSVIVNGVRFETNSASFEIDGTAGVQSDLAVGDVVTVVGTVNENGSDAQASSVSFDDVVEGPVSAVNVGAATLTVLGQTVLVDAGTSFDDNISPASLDGIKVGDIVEVSGFRRADGSVVATRIEAKPAGGEFEVTGLVSNLSGVTLSINALSVDFSAAQLDDFPGGSPENGQLIEAKGSTIGSAGELVATRLEFKGNTLGGDNGDRAEIEGFVTRFVSAADFDVEGIPVSAGSGTTYVNGSAADLALNRKLEVEGTINASGTLVAERIEIKLSNFIRIEGRVDSATASAVVIFGVTINVDSLTRFEDKSSAEVQNFSIGDVNSGDYLETRGFEDSRGIVAIRVERDDFDGDVAIRAFVDSVSDPSFTINGVPIETNGATVFRDVNDQAISAATFFANANGRLVEAAGSESNGGILADQVDFED